MFSDLLPRSLGQHPRGSPSGPLEQNDRSKDQRATHILNRIRAFAQDDDCEQDGAHRLERAQDRSPRMKVSTGIVVPTTAKLAIRKSRGSVQATASWPLSDAYAVHTKAADVMIIAVADTGGRPGNSRLP